MCFHFSLTQKMSVIEQTLRVHWEGAEWQPIYHADGFTFLHMPVVTQQDPGKVQLFNWGLIPQWVRTKVDADKLKAQTLNARSETVFEKPSFRSSVNHYRCLVPADGFFEWMDFNKKKYPHYIYLKEHPVFCFGGLYAHWTDKQTGEIISTFSILTTEANPMMAKIHNLKQRMPVIIPPDRYTEWLTPNLSAEKIRSFFQPYPETAMESHTITKLITSRTQSSDVPEVIARWDYPELLFLNS